jgi:hypothetical protein
LLATYAAYGIKFTASFQVLGKNVNKGYYWAQYFNASTAITLGGKTIIAQNTAKAWYVDGKNLMLNNMPNAIKPSFTTDDTFSDFAHVEHLVLAKAIDLKAFTTGSDPIHGLFLPTAPNQVKSFLENDAATLKVTDKTDASYQLYLVNANTKEPLGYITWGYHYDMNPGKFAFTAEQPRWIPWNPKAANNVWNVAKYPPK